MLAGIANDVRGQLLRALARPAISLERMECRDASIVSHWRITGRNVCGISQLGIRPNGRVLDVQAVTVDSIVDGVPFSRTLVDLSEVLAQIGDVEDHPSTA